MPVLRLVQLSDTHLLRPGEPASEAARLRLERVLDWIAAGPAPAALLATGDLADQADPEAYAWFSRRVAGLGVPVLALPGNHDDPSGLAAYLTLSPVREPRLWRSGDWAVCLLDSQQDGECGGWLGAERLAALDALLATEAAPHWLVAVHHPPVAVGSPWMDAMGLADGAALLARLAADGRTRAVVWGHIHQPFEAVHHRMRLLGCPATRVQFARRSPVHVIGDTRPGLRWLELGEEGGVYTGVVWLPDDDPGAGTLP